MYPEVVSELGHRLRVMLMYRTGLRELLNWSMSRHVWYPRAEALRAEFEANRAIVGRVTHRFDDGEDGFHL